MRRLRAEVQTHAATRRRLFEALARGHAIVERLQQTTESCEALMVQAAERLHARSSRDPRLHLLGEDEEVR